MRIAVTAPHGNVGRHLTRALVRAGVRPRLLMRRPDRLPADLRDFVEVARADSWDTELVVAATREVEAIYWVDPTSAGADPLADYARATEAVTAAVTRNGIGRVVFQSSVGAEKRHGAGEIDGLAGTEVALNETGVDVTHLRCGYFFTNLLLQIDALRAGTLQVVLPLDAPMSWVAPRDIAEVAAAVLLNPAWSGRHVRAVHGPADLTWNDVASILSTELGRPITVEQISDQAMYDQYVQAGMPPGLAEAVLGMSTGLRDGFVPEQDRTAATTTPTTLSSWVHDELTKSLT
ncbi:NmrA family NAD(P)-binding protein [Nonomuraea jabiensis]|uniref:NmrA family NAD(P)-binding protein n=1 Tax=Nonomuraea jabiensis TaxID=882448 RepID=UPI0036ADA6BF